MAVSTELHYASVDELFLDPRNPRLGHEKIEEQLSQAEILEIMRDWKPEELAISYLEGGGFWPQEALLVVKEPINGEDRLVVVEGNRRLAALMLLRDAYTAPESAPSKFRSIAESGDPPDKLFEKVPYLEIDDRTDVDAFLGFRHVTGIKQWRPAEKAAYIARLIEDRGMSYREVMRKIGSQTPTVRQNYIAFGLMRQIGEEVEGVAEHHVEQRFSVMYLSLRTHGVQHFLEIDIKAEPDAAQRPANGADENLADYAVWLFGTDERPPLFSDSRLTDKFGQILESDDAVAYLRRSDKPKFEVAHEIAGGDEPEIVNLILSAADNIEAALGRVHHYKKSKDIKNAVERLGKDVSQLLSVFPDIRDRIEDDEES